MSALTYPAIPGFKDKSAGSTSQDAAKKIEPKSNTLRWQVLDCLKSSAIGLTADECAARLSVSILSVRPRFSELRAMGQIVDTGARRRSSNGNSQSVWRAA